MISIVTATYNRAHLLPRLYESLKSQENKNFEWVVVDDGSVDNTENLIMEFNAENLININYLKKDNGGKHTALNLGISIAKYEYTFFLDSDDYFSNNSFEDVYNFFEANQNKTDVVAIKLIISLLKEIPFNSDFFSIIAIFVSSPGI